MSNLEKTGANSSSASGVTGVAGTIDESAQVIAFEYLRMTDVEVVGGKNASLGEMISQLAGAGVSVPGGFATTAHAFREQADSANGHR
jgi:pyruvate,water dikinase